MRDPLPINSPGGTGTVPRNDAATSHLAEHARLRADWPHWSSGSGAHAGLTDFHRSGRLPGNIFRRNSK